MKIRLLGAGLFHADEQVIDGQIYKHKDRRGEANCRFSQFCKGP